MASNAALSFLAKKFRIPGDYISAVPYGSGHINDTFLATYEHFDERVRYIHQKLNTNIFPNPVTLMENVSRVVDHLITRESRPSTGPSPRSYLQLVPTFDGCSYYVHEGTEYWRTFLFIEGAETLDVAETPEHARQAAATFGWFQLLLADLPGPRLHETIVDFHNTTKRFGQLLEALDADMLDRTRRCETEAEFARSRSGLASALTSQINSGAIPERITHNDTKLNNVMFDIETGEGVCVIDLDTVMPGSVLYDFGDMVRTATMTAPEDEPDLSKVSMDRGLFGATVEGYLSSAGHWLNKAEKASLVLSGRVMAFESGIRFLTDFLNGDKYFKIEYPDHNLIRSRAQFALLRSMETESDYMEEIVRNVLISRQPTEQ